MRQKTGSLRSVSTGAIGAFFGGMGTLVLALLSPIDHMGEQLFSIHMVQHLLLMIVAAPLMAWSRPALVFLWALPPLGRKRVGRGWSGMGFRSVFRGLMNPAVVWVLFSGSFVFWHCPGPYDWALKNELVHALEHLSFFVSALMFWTIVFEPGEYRRLGYGATLLFVGSTAVLSGLPGALLILAPRPLYAVHAAGVAAWHMTLVQDQQLAGVIMWVPAGSVYIAAMCYLFVKMMAEPERRVLRRTSAVLAPVLLLLVLPLLSGCNDHGAREVARRIGSPSAGAKLIGQYGCGACHLIPGIDGAEGVVGPPLLQVGRRIFIAGVLRNTPNNMVRWLRDPQKVVPGNGMPDMHITEPDAENIAAYLYTLR
jgi:cytochrome c oxidase assembly factor CtaG/cytochrome c2